MNTIEEDISKLIEKELTEKRKREIELMFALIRELEEGKE